MPQMNPILWLFLFITFTVTFLLVNPLIFFSKNFSSKVSSLNASLTTLTWKW
uniref:ATP synthase complex subunit 8 n=1 Tax=Lachesilla sp. Lasp7Q TaxID=2597021 RepID=A0A8K1ZFX8_9NEOP|nr:ATP synthase F0 subunit 8 [Lachesilla sp. Lasp7Q]